MKEEDTVPLRVKKVSIMLNTPDKGNLILSDVVASICFALIISTATNEVHNLGDDYSSSR